jgi:hypothetical protein
MMCRRPECCNCRRYTGACAAVTAAAASYIHVYHEQLVVVQFVKWAVSAIARYLAQQQEHPTCCQLWIMTRPADLVDLRLF